MWAATFCLRHRGWAPASSHDFLHLVAEPQKYLDLLIRELENFIQHGFKRLILLNGHGGNMVPGAQVVFELRQKLRDRSDLLLLHHLLGKR